jgi:hypothetical protein
VTEIKRIEFDSKIVDFEKVNPEFAKVKVIIAYAGQNRNGSYISKETFEKMLPSLINVPIVGEWKEQDENFGSHGGKIELSDEGFKYIDTTKPYGVVNESSEIKWETILEKDGLTENEYLTCTALLWHGRYQEIEKILNDGANQSMEIGIKSGYYDEEQKTYIIEDGYFSALCILGKDSNPKKNVEPCFEEASIGRYSFNKDEFKKDFDEMMDTIKLSFQNTEKGEVKDLAKTKKFEAETEVVETEVTVVEEIVEPVEEVIGVIDEETGGTIVDIVDEIDEVAETEVVETVEEPVSEEVVEDFEAIKVENETLKTENQKLKDENQKLNEYKLSKEKDEKVNIVNSFNGLSSEEKEKIVEEIDTYSLETIEEKLMVIWAKKNYTASKTTDKSNKTDVKNLVFGLADSENVDKPIYYDIIQKHKK